MAGQSAPKRVVSLNLCADELVLALADKSSIQSVSWLVADPQMSFYADEAGGLHLNRGGAEEVLSLHPDLVVAGTYTTRATRTVLEDHGIPLLILELPESLVEVFEQIRTVADHLGRQERGAGLIAELRRQIEALRVPVQWRGLVYHPNGFTNGAGTLVDEMLAITGYENVASASGVQGFSQFSLERVVMNPPDVLVINQVAEDLPSMADQILAHRALKRSSLQIVEVPFKAWTCGSPALVEGLRILRSATGGQEEISR